MQEGVYLEGEKVVNDFYINLDNIVKVHYKEFEALQLESSSKLISYTKDPSKRSYSKPVHVKQIEMDTFELNFLETAQNEYDRIKAIIEKMTLWYFVMTALLFLVPIHYMGTNPSFSVTTHPPDSC